MKKHLIFAFLCVLAGALSMAAQGRDDALIVGAGYSTPAATPDDVWLGGPIYKEMFYKFDVSAGYEKFLWRGFFVKPQASLWYSNNPRDEVYVIYTEDNAGKAHKGSDSSKAYQIGGSLELMGAWRQQFGKGFSSEILAGPMLNLCILSRVKKYGYTFNHLYRTATLDWRFGIGFNIMSHLRLGVDFDLRPGKHKRIEYNSYDHFGGFEPSSHKRRNAWRFSVGYRF